MKIGVAYYPEQWPRERWEADARCMAKFGIDVVKIGEFAWSNLEPRRERMEMDWLDEAITVLAGAGLKVILCTPTSAPPPWLFNRHKSILPENRDGVRCYCGSRRHVCLNNPAYLKYVRRIVTELARRFGGRTELYAWQIDNELSAGDTGVCYCDECEQAFRMWLKRRYGTIDRLNKLWCTSFWSQQFVDWHEIPVPRRTAIAPHPSLLLDYKRFTSAQTRAFANGQKEIIRQFSSREIPVTVNEPWPHCLTHINTFSLAEVQDVVSVDNFPCDSSRLPETVMGLDFTRSLKHAPFWVMQQQAGAALIPGQFRQPHPGQLRLWMYQAAARGADLLCFFRWRTAGAGQEMNWYGILDADGVSGRRYEELKQAVSEIKTVSGQWQGLLPRTTAAVCLDFESAWALQSAELGCEPDYFRQVADLHDCFRSKGITADFVTARRPLNGYAVVALPMPFIASNKMVAELERYVRQGGVLLGPAPAGYVSGANTTGDIRPPGALASLLGVEVREYDIPADESARIVFDDNSSFRAEDMLCFPDLKGARPLARYEKGPDSALPAVTLSDVGKGHAMYLSAGLAREGLDRVVDCALDAAGVRPVIWTASDAVEVVELHVEKAEKRRIFILNHRSESGTVEFRQDACGRELLAGATFKGSLELDPYAAALVELDVASCV